VTAPLAAVQARITSIESRFTLPAGVTQAPGGADQFAAILADATGRAATLDAATASNGSTAASWSQPGPGSGNGQRVVELAKRHLGTPYVWGGTEPGGFDCSGLVQYAYRQAGVELPRTSREQARAGQAVASLADARPGDLVAFGSPVDHIGIYAGDNTMVVAPHRGDVVKVQQIYRTPTAIRRVLPAAG
jgi:cell wall-associated NlpC family hydrolase